MESFIKGFERPSPKVVEELEPALAYQELHQVMDLLDDKVELPMDYENMLYDRLKLPMDYGNMLLSAADTLNGSSESELKLPKDYEDIIRWSKDRMSWETMKDLYYIFRRGFLINYGEEWFSLDKDGKKCLMLSARAALDEHKWNWMSLAETRFEEVANYCNLPKFSIFCKFRSKLLSPETTYGAYLVYKLSEGYKNAKPLLVQVIDKEDSHSKEVDNIFLQTPAISCDAKNKASFNPRMKGLPKRRSDGWMEVQVHEFQTRPSIKMISTRLQLSSYDYDTGLKEITVQCLEFRPCII